MDPDTKEFRCAVLSGTLLRNIEFGFSTFEKVIGGTTVPNEKCVGSMFLVCINQSCQSENDKKIIDKAIDVFSRIIDCENEERLVFFLTQCVKNTISRYDSIKNNLINIVNDAKKYISVDSNKKDKNYEQIKKITDNIDTDAIIFEPTHKIMELIHSVTTKIYNNDNETSYVQNIQLLYTYLQGDKFPKRFKGKLTGFKPIKKSSSYHGKRRIIAALHGLIDMTHDSLEMSNIISALDFLHNFKN